MYQAHDITDGVQYLIKEGIADPKRVAIFGVSYGGYATLAGVAFTPDLYAAGVSYVGPSNLITLLKSIPPYWAPVKKVFAVRVGDMDRPEELKMLQEQSPLNSAKQIKGPPRTMGELQTLEEWENSSKIEWIARFARI